MSEDCREISHGNAGSEILLKLEAAYPFRNFEDLLLTQFFWHSSLLYKLITVSEWRFQARLASWLHPSIYDIVSAHLSHLLFPPSPSPS